MWIHIQRLDFVPLVRISGASADTRAGSFSDQDLSEDLRTILREMHADYAAHRRSASIIDLTDAAALNAKQRAVVSTWVKDTRELSRHTSISTAFVAPSALVRGALTAIFWTQSFGVPHRVFATLHDAVVWSLDHIRATGLEVAEGTDRAVMHAFERRQRHPPAVGS